MLDTCICIDLIRGRGGGVLERLRACGTGDAGISVITLAELELGVEKSSRPAQNRLALSEFCAPLDIPPFDDSAALSYGAIRAVLEKAGRVIGPMDLLIAAHAVALATVLVTSNEREFRRVPDLQVENWR
jgi:tRNA(fMet)-specific endonuclease VapC